MKSKIELHFKSLRKKYDERKVKLTTDSHSLYILLSYAEKGMKDNPLKVPDEQINEVHKIVEALHDEVYGTSVYAPTFNSIKNSYNKTYEL